MKLKSLIGLFVCCALFFLGCRDDREVSVAVIELTKSSDFTEYPDSSFFKDITCMSVNDGKLYMFDATRGDVAMWSKDDNRFLTFGGIGQGPREVANPKTFFVQDDKVAIMDNGSQSLKIYDEEGGVEMVDIPASNEWRFFIEKDTVYLTCTYKETFFVKSGKQWKREDYETGLLFGGTLFKITESKGMNRMRNNRHLVKGNNCFYAVCPSYPILEKYDLKTNELIASYDLSKVDIIRENLEYIESQNQAPNTVSLYLKDAYFHKEKLYVLCATWKNGFEVNKLLVLDEGLSPLGIYKLPGGFYNSFCVDDKFIYAMNYGRCAVEMFEVPSSF